VPRRIGRTSWRRCWASEDDRPHRQDCTRISSRALLGPWFLEGLLTEVKPLRTVLLACSFALLLQQLGLRVEELTSVDYDCDLLRKF